MAIPTLHNLQILRGLTTNLCLLSCTSDGTKVDLDQLQPGDDVRASFDPTTKQVATVTVQSNQTNKAR